MIKIKSTLAQVILVLTAISFGFVCFLSANFYTIGDTKKSLIIAGIITVLLAVLAYLASWFKGVKGNFKRNRIVEYVVIGSFTVAIAFFTNSSFFTNSTFFTNSPFSHYFTVSDKKEAIKNQLSETITEAQGMFSTYESYANGRTTSYHATLQSIVRAKEKGSGTTNDYDAYGFKNNEVSSKIQINNKMHTIKNELFPTNYTDTINGNGIKEVAEDWLADAQKKATGWKPIGIVSVVNDIEEKSKGWRNDLVSYSTIRENGEQAQDFGYDLPFPDLKANFTTHEKPTLLSIGWALLAWVLMLLSWFITKRDGKILKGLAPYEIEL
jgi:hypothetical protein